MIYLLLLFSVAVIDVRTPEEHAKLFISNSYNFPLEKFDDSDSGKNLWDCIHQRYWRPLLA